MTNRTVIGIDPSLTSTGITRIHPNGQTETQRIQTKGTKNATLKQRYRRLDNLYTQICANIPHNTLVIIEGPAYANQAGSMHDRSGLWWLTIDELLLNDIDTAEVPPTLLKKYATGKGNASKDEVLAAAIRRYPDINITGNDTADATILAAIGRRHLGAPIDNMPAINTTTLDKIRWP